MFNSIDRAVEFGKIVDKFNPKKVIPYIYNFVHSDNDKWITEKVFNNLSGIGPEIQPQSTIEWPIKLDSDANYLLEFIRFTVYNTYYPYVWYEQHSSWFEDVNCDKIGTSLLKYIRVALIDKTNDQFVYGANNVTNQVPMLINPTTLQGNDYGVGQIMFKRLLAKDTILLIRINNIHNNTPLVVGGMLYGKKYYI